MESVEYNGNQEMLVPVKKHTYLILGSPKPLKLVSHASEHIFFNPIKTDDIPSMLHLRGYLQHEHVSQNLSMKKDNFLPNSMFQK